MLGFDKKSFLSKSCARVFLLGIAVLFFTSAKHSVAQNFGADSTHSFFSGMAGRKASVGSVQPTGWPGALVTANPLLFQCYRSEFSRQIVTPGVPTWNIGNGKGLNLIVSKRVEFNAVVPNYVFHNSSKVKDGFGDYVTYSKIRLLSGTNDHGNYTLSALTGQTFSSGQAKNGAASYTRSYTLMGGKGFGSRSVLQSTAGVTAPAAGGLKLIGHPVVWNTVVEQRVLPKLWLEVENNATFYHGGSHDGKVQNYITPGFITGRLRPRSWSERDHRALVLGAAMQVATSEFKTSNHNIVMDARWVF